MRISRDRMAEWKPGDSQKELSSLIPPRDYSGMNTELQNVQLRVWLPDPAKIGLEEICQRAETSMTVYLTEYFIEYIYGRHELLKMRENCSGLYEPKPEFKYNMERTRSQLQPTNLGKNIFPLKIFIPTKIKDALQALANRAQTSLGEFTRALICAHLFGRTHGHKKLMFLTSHEESVANRWENSDELVPEN